VRFFCGTETPQTNSKKQKQNRSPRHSSLRHHLHASAALTFTLWALIFTLQLTALHPFAHPHLVTPFAPLFSLLFVLLCLVVALRLAVFIFTLLLLLRLRPPPHLPHYHTHTPSVSLSTLHPLISAARDASPPFPGPADRAWPRCCAVETPPREKNRRATDDDQSNDATLSAVWPAIFTPFVYPPNVYNPPFRHKPATHCDRIRCSSPLCPFYPRQCPEESHRHNLRGLDASSVVPPLCFVERLHPARRAPFRAAYVGAAPHSVLATGVHPLVESVSFFHFCFPATKPETHTHTLEKNQNLLRLKILRQGRYSR